MDWESLSKLAKERQEAEAAKPLEQRQQEYREREEEWWLKGEEGQLCQQFYKAYCAYSDYLKNHSRRSRNGNGTEFDFVEHRVYVEVARHAEQFRAQEKEREREDAEKSRENLEKARLAARCEHILLDGRRCRSPRMKDNTLCYWHDQMERTKAEKLDLGPMEDPDSIQIAIRKLQAAVIDGSLEQKQVSQLAYLIQLAAWNVMRTSLTAKMMEKEESTH